ncbi:MAG TPA: hypothetical protein PKH65_07600 [Bacteroidia bacterium]|nr:hypothetical protein [Bacteroidia bacterium]HNT80529.1 hypothetical protein [Bacteroidia bacterium]
MNAKIFGTLILLAALQASDVRAQMDNLANLSPEWIRTAARNASTDGTDAVVFNPAGASRLGDGFHITIGNQSLFRKPTHSYDMGMGEGTKSFTQSGSDALLPNLYASFNRGNWAYTGGVFISGGGATANYPKGSITTDMIGLMTLMAAQGAYTTTTDQYLEASSYYLTTMLGAAYSVNDKFSFGANIRYTTANNTSKAGITLSGSPFDLPDQTLSYDVEDKASGMNASLGVMITPSTNWGFTVRYETAVPLDFKTNITKDDFGLSTQGETHSRDLPAVLATGIRYHVNTKLTLLAEYNAYFQENADWGKSGLATAEKANSDLAGNASSYAMAAEYAFTNKFLWSVGVVKTDFSWNDRDGYYTNLGAFEVVYGDNTSINTGVKFKLNEMIAFNAGYAHTMWKKDDTIKVLNLAPMDVTATVNNSMNTFALGVDLKF